MYDFEVSEKLEKILSKLSKKDKNRYEATLKKMQEVAKTIDIDHYKNLKYRMKEFKRVHIDSHFVLIFRLEGNQIEFFDLQHHDDIYR